MWTTTAVLSLARSQPSLLASTAPDSLTLCDRRRGDLRPRQARDVDFALGTLAKRLSTRSVRLARMILIQAIRNAMVNDLVATKISNDWMVRLMSSGNGGN